MRKSLVLLIVMMAAIGLGACGKKPVKPDESSQQTTQDPNANGAGVGSANADSSDDTTQGPLEGLLAKRTIYFDFDSSEIRGEGTDIVAAHAKYLAQRGGMKVRLEGHTDERGSREYNIGLGERRAQAVRRALMLQGVTENQITTVSYGEERPAVQGSDEAAYAKNRRVELVYGR